MKIRQLGYRLLGVGLACSFTLSTALPSLAKGNLSPSVATPTDPLSIRKAFKLEHDPLTSLVLVEETSVKAVLRGLAQKVNLNMIYMVESEDEEDEDLTLPAMEMRNIPVSEAFAFILRVKGLVGRRMYNSLLITTPEGAAKNGFSAPIIKTYPIYNQMAGQTLGAGGAGGAAGGIQQHLEAIFKLRNIQPLPQIIMDQRTSTMIVMGTSEAIDIADNLVPVLDKPLPQVMVEIKLIELTKQGSQELGLSYGFSQGKAGASFNVSGAAGGGGGGLIIPQTNPTLLGNPDSGSGVGINFNSLANFAPNFNAKLNALIQNSQAKVLTNPRIAIQHGVKAIFDSTTNIPIISTTATATSTVQTVQSLDIGEKIDITPFIDTEKGYITMKLTPDISTRGQTVNTGSTGAIPEKNTRKVNTTLRVKDGESIVIGGMIRQTEGQSTSKVPFLGDIPFLGSLFSSTTSSTEEVELLIIVTPRIMRIE